MFIREFAPNDTESVYMIALESLDEKYEPSVFGFFQSLWPGGQLVACDTAGKPVGFIFSTKIQNSAARIMMIAVSPEYRGNGIGQQLLDRFRLNAKLAGIYSITLEVRPTNIRAMKFYKRNGFAETETLYNFYQDGGNAVRMNGPIQRLN